MRVACSRIALALVLSFAVAGPLSAETVTESYVYDAAGRLVGVGFGGTGLGYSYDAAGNLLARTVPEPGAGAVAAAAWIALAALARRRRRAAAFAVAAAALAIANPARAHFCKSPNIEMVQGQTLDDVFAIDADFEEDVSLYTVTSVNPPGFVTVAPAGPNYQTHDLFVNILANTVTNGTVQIFWDYPPNFASGTCVFNINVKANGQTTSNADHRHSGLAGDPVNTLTGEFVTNEPPDLFLPGPMPVFFQRYYGSALQRLFVTSKMGVNWRHNFDWTIHFNGNTLTVKDARGRVTRWLQTDTINHVWTQQNNLDLPLTVRQEVLATENHFHILDPRTDHIYKFSVPPSADRYYLVEIRDGRGNALALTHSLDGELETVSDGLGRTLTFSYYDWTFGGWLRSVSDGTRTVTFTTTPGGLLQGVTDAAGEGWGYTYTTNNFDQGLMTSKVWPEGNVPWTQTWDTQSRVATQTTAAGDLTTFSYAPGATGISDPRSNQSLLEHDAGGRLTATTDAASRTRSLEYGGGGNRSAVEQPSGARHLASHDAASARIASVTNAAGRTVSYQYANRTVAPGFSVRELAGIAFPDGRSTAYAYDANGNQTSFTDRGADTWTRTFNARSQVLTETNPLGGTTTYAYNADGTLASLTNPAGHTTTFQYDLHKRTTRVNRPGGAFRTFQWDARDRLTQLRTEAGAVTSFAYDGNGRLVTMVDPGGAVETWGYDAMNRRVTRTDRTGAVTTVAYDELGAPASVTLAGLGSYGFEIGDDGRLTGITLPDASAFDVHFDASGRMTGTTNPAGQSESTALDGDDLVVARTDHGGRTTSFGRDLLGRVSSATDPSGIQETYQYGPEDEVSRVAVGPLDVDFAYDAMGGMTSAVDPNGRTWSWSYDARGLVTSTTDPLGRATVFAYDARDRVSQATYPGGLGNVQISYDGVGNAARRLHSDGVDVGYTRDAHGRLTAAPGVALGYDARHRVTSSNGITATRTPHVGQVAALTLAPGKTVTYAYDALGRPASVTDWLGGVTTFAYDAAGQLTGIERPNGVDSTIGYDASGRITQIAHGALGGVALVRDPAGRPVSAVRNLPTATPPTSAASFAYDAASQVQGSGWSYDALGRRTGGAGRSYGWDLASRLASVVEGATTTTLGWDAFGRLTSFDRGATNRDYVWNYALPFPAVSIELEDGVPLRHYVHHPSGRLLYWVDAADGARHFPLFDERGNTVLVTNGAGAVEAGYAYSPYGAVAASSPGFDNPRTFVGEWGGHALGGGLYVFGRRVYDADTAAFLSRDPAHPHLHPLTFNPYQYAGRDPMSRFDPLGADPVDAAAANQNASSQGGALDTARNALSTVTSVSDIAGAELGTAADETARAATRALGASDVLSHTAHEFIADNLGGNATSRRVLKRAEEYMSEFQRLDARADKLAGASRTMKAVGAAGNAFTALDIGIELHKLFDRIFEAHAINDQIVIGLYRSSINQTAAAFEIFERGKQNEYWLRKQLIDIQYNLKMQLLWQGYLHSVENHINFWTAVGNIYGAFVPGFGFVGTEAIAESAHRNIWNPVFHTLGNPWD